MSTTVLRPELTPLPDRMRGLPVDSRGYPIPWFVAFLPNGEPEFRAMDPKKWNRAINENRCWICGEKLGIYLTFVIGPMCGITRTTSEPPGHRECARWSAINCPFLSRPHMDRREHDKLVDEGWKSPAGVPILRNPGVALLWTTTSYKPFRPPDGGTLLTVGPPIEVEWWAEGRAATWNEVNASIASGLPLLEAEARKEEGGLSALYKELERLRPLYPKPEVLE